MSISQRERTALAAMEHDLACSSPKLASMLTIFSRLTGLADVLMIRDGFVPQLYPKP